MIGWFWLFVVKCIMRLAEECFHVWMHGLIVSGDEDVIGGCRWTTYYSIFGAQRIDIG